MGKKQSKKPIETVKPIQEASEQIDQARLEIDRKRLELDAEKNRVEGKLLNKHLGAILTAFVALGSVHAALQQGAVTKYLGEQQTQILRDQQRLNLQADQDQKAAAREIKLKEQEARSADMSLKFAQFLVDNQIDLFSNDTGRRKRMEAILFATFDSQTIVPVIERLKSVQPPLYSQDNLDSLLTKAKEIDTQNLQLLAKNKGGLRLITAAPDPIEIEDTSHPQNEEELADKEPNPQYGANLKTKTAPAVVKLANNMERTALVIGNQSYVKAPLKNAVNDAKDIAAALQELGFKVNYQENVNQKSMKMAIRAFGDKLRSSKGVGLFYYAGHAVQVDGKNYFVPIDAEIERANDLEYEGVEAGYVLAQMESANNPMNLVILDACRNNPFAGISRSLSLSVAYDLSYNFKNPLGLATMDAPRGTLLAFATAPGSIASDGNARNGIYTQELLKHIRTPDISVEEVFKRVRLAVMNLTRGRQVPWETSSLTGNFYFVKQTSLTAETNSDAKMDSGR